MSDEIPILDVALLRERTFGDADVLREVVGIFLAECPGWMATIREAVRAGDAAKLRLAAHLVTGTGGTCGAARLAGSAQKLEAMGKAGRLDEAEDEAERLYAAAQELEPLLRALL